MLRRGGLLEWWRPPSVTLDEAAPMPTRALLLLPLLLAGCAEDPAAVEGVELLDARRQLIRLSVDLRGVHPSEAELAAIEANPDLYEGYVDRWLDDDRLLPRMREVFNQRFLVETGGTYGQGYPGASSRQVAAAIADEPLRLIERIIDQDLPYTEVVTADYTMANPLLAEMWDLERTESSSGWEPARYQDGREHAGVLSMSSVWLRYDSMGGNANRHRANAVSKMLLCDDYLSRPIVLNRAAVDQLIEDPETAIRTNESCQSCHSTLDPLSAHFFGFFYYDDEDGDASMYRPENEQDWRNYAGDPPGFYGVPTAGLGELGDMLADDPRVVDCAVQTVWEGLNQRSLTDDDWEEIQAHRAAFVDAGLTVKPLVKSVVMSAEYRAGEVLDEELAERLPSVRLASPAQLETIIEDLTGYRWSFGGVPALRNHGMGIPVLLGGVDGSNVTTRGYEASVGGVFVQERLAWAAAWHVVQRDLDPTRTDDALLLRYVTIEDTPDTAPAAFEQQIRFLYERVTGVPLGTGATEPANLIALWRQLHSVEGTPEAAWAGVVSAVLRDPMVLHY